LRVGGEPARATAFHVLDQPIQKPDPATMPDMMRVHGEEEDAALFPRAVEFGAEYLFNG